jgi:hypothetical protein
MSRKDCLTYELRYQAIDRILSPIFGRIRNLSWQ